MYGVKNQWCVGIRRVLEFHLHGRESVLCRADTELMAWTGTAAVARAGSDAGVLPLQRGETQAGDRRRCSVAPATLGRSACQPVSRLPTCVAFRKLT